MGGCGYNAQLGAALPKKQAPVASAPPASATAEPPAEGFRRSRRSRRRAAFGASKPVSCDATLFDVIRSLFRKPVDVACTLSTLHKVFHGVLLVVVTLRLLLRVSPIPKEYAQRLIAILLAIYIGFALSVSVENTKNGSKEQKVSGVLEIVVGCLYLIPLLVVTTAGIAGLEDLLRGVLVRIQTILDRIPILGNIVGVSQRVTQRLSRI